jgi:hypothetical protein
MNPFSFVSQTPNNANHNNDVWQNAHRAFTTKPLTNAEMISHTAITADQNVEIIVRTNLRMLGLYGNTDGDRYLVTAIILVLSNPAYLTMEQPVTKFLYPAVAKIASQQKGRSVSTESVQMAFRVSIDKFFKNPYAANVFFQVHQSLISKAKPSPKAFIAAIADSVRSQILYGVNPFQNFQTGFGF